MPYIPPTGHTSRLLLWFGGTVKSPNFWYFYRNRRSTDPAGRFRLTCTTRPASNKTAPAHPISPNPYASKIPYWQSLTNMGNRSSTSTSSVEEKGSGMFLTDELQGRAVSLIYVRPGALMALHGFVPGNMRSFSRLF